MMGQLPARAAQAVALIRRELAVLESACLGGFQRGDSFERELLAICRSRGFSARRIKSQCHVDMIVNELRVQCKQTNKTSGSFGLYDGRKMPYEHTDFDVLAVRTPEAILFVPSKSIPQRHGKLRQHLAISKLRRWVDAWHVLEGNAQAKELTLFGHEEATSNGW